MPQMSPMLWLNLYFYFIMISMIIMLMVFNFLSYKNLMNKKFNFYKINYKLKW